MSNASPFSTMVNIFVDPGKAYEDIKGHNAWLWWPLVLTIVATIAMTVVFYTHADVAAMLQQQLAAKHVQQTPEQMQAMAKFQKPAVMIGVGAVSAIIAIFVIYAISALYYMLVGKLAGWNEQRFSSWFGFTAWSAFPGFLGTLISIVVLLMRSQPSTSFQDVDVLSINALLLHLPMTSKWYSLVSGISPFTIWSIVLAIFGLSRWTRRSGTYATVVVLAPLVLFYGLMIAFKAFA